MSKVPLLHQFNFEKRKDTPVSVSSRIYQVEHGMRNAEVLIPILEAAEAARKTLLTKLPGGLFKQQVYAQQFAKQDPMYVSDINSMVAPKQPKVQKLPPAALVEKTILDEPLELDQVQLEAMVADAHETASVAQPSASPAVFDEAEARTVIAETKAVMNEETRIQQLSQAAVDAAQSIKESNAHLEQITV